MAAYKFIISRRSITNEVYEIEADTEEEALEMANNGELDEPFLEWVDWYDGNYGVDSQECLDPLVNMIKNYEEKSVDTLDQ